MKHLRNIFFVIFFVLFFLMPFSQLKAQGNFEFGFHYSRWSLNILKGVLEEGMSEALETDLKDEFLTEIQKDHPFLTERSYSQSVLFDSNGSNWGFEMRWYPAGRYGSFSLGFSVEKTSMRVQVPELAVDMELSDGSIFEANTNAEFFLNPLSFHMSLRWDIVPTSRIRPYITLGVGIATGTALENAEFSFAYTGTLRIIGDDPEQYSGGEQMTLQELKEEIEEEGEDFFLPGFIPFFQLNLGLKSEVTENIHLLIDAGIWNGLLFRMGLAFRF